MTDLVKAGGGNGEWAKAQLNNTVVAAPIPVPAPVTSLPTKWNNSRDINPYTKPYNTVRTGFTGGMVRIQVLPFVSKM